MNLELVEPHPRRVLEAFQRGEFDGLEILDQPDEKAFFKLCFGERMLERLALRMPTARRREEVPPRVVHSGSQPEFEIVWRTLLSGLEAGGAVRRAVGRLGSGDGHQAPESSEPGSGARLRGFNLKNHRERQSPYDQDTLRSWQDVPAARWQEWFNGPVQEGFRAHGLFDQEGVSSGTAVTCSAGQPGLRRLGGDAVRRAQLSDSIPPSAADQLPRLPFHLSPFETPAPSTPPTPSPARIPISMPCQNP